MFIIIYGLILALILSACAPEEMSVEVHESEPEPVSFHHYFSGPLSGGIDDLVNRYNLNQSKYHLNAVPIDHEAYKVNILESFSTGTPSDINTYWAGARTQSVLEYLEPLDLVFEQNNIAQEFPRALLESASKYEGHYYLIPITQHYVTFYYNVETFEALGLAEPTTWDEFTQVCETLKTNGVTPIGLGAKDRWPAQFWFDYLLLRTAGYQYRTGLMELDNNYNDPEVARVIEIWKDMIDKGYFNNMATEIGWDIDIMNPLMDGDIGMTLMGTWFSSILDQEGFGGQYGVFSFPVIDSEVSYTSVGPVDGVILGKDALNKEGAKDAILQFSELTNQIEMGMGSGAFVPNRKTPDNVYDELHLKMLKDMNRSKYWAFNYDLATSPELAEEGLDFFIEFLNFPDAYETLLDDLTKATKQLK